MAALAAREPGLSSAVATGLEGALSRGLEEILPGGARGAACRLGPDDHRYLTPAEGARLGQAVLARRRASGAARRLARALLGADPMLPPDILWSASGAPVWPAGLVGSLAHDESVAVAVLGPAAAFGGLGVDVEPAEPLDEDVVPVVVRADERRAFGDDPLRAKLLFCVKEAVFKAVHPADGRFLDFADVAVDRDGDREGGLARTSYGRVVQWRALVRPSVIAVAWW